MSRHSPTERIILGHKAWRQACQDHGVEPTPEALRAVLRRVDAGCVAEAPRCLDCGRSAEQVDGRWRPRC